MTLADFRELVAPQNPFALGAYPDRPAPVHVANGFFAAALGVSSHSTSIRRLLVSGDKPSDDFRFLDGQEWDTDHFVDGVGWARSAERLAAFRSDLAQVFNPDRRMWPAVGSPTAIHAGLVGSDPSDERLGPLVWELVQRNAPEDYAQTLSALLRPSECHDPLTATATILSDGFATGDRRAVHISESAWFGTMGSPAGQQLASHLAEFVVNLTVPWNDARRLLQIQDLIRGLYLVALLALLRGPTLSGEESDSEVPPAPQILAWGGLPPGRASNPTVAAAARSFQLVVEHCRGGLNRDLQRGLLGHELPSNLPSNQRRRWVIQAQLVAAGVRENQRSKVMERLEGDVTVDNSEVAPDEWISEVVEFAYASDRLTRGFRSMGRKVGFVGPDRGAGVPRFLCETPLLGTLVAGLCPTGSMDFEDFVDRVREKLGVVFGPGTQDDSAERLGLWEGVGVGTQLLVDNQEHLRTRMVRAGLAREYSDGHTEITRD